MKTAEQIKSEIAARKAQMAAIYAAVEAKVGPNASEQEMEPALTSAGYYRLYSVKLTEEELFILETDREAEKAEAQERAILNRVQGDSEDALYAARKAGGWEDAH